MIQKEQVVEKIIKKYLQSVNTDNTVNTDMKFTGTNPIFIQIADYIKNLIDNGTFKNGDAMWSVREFALANGVNPNTVARAYEILVQDGYLESIPKKGYFVSKGDKVPQKDLKKLDSIIDSLLSNGYTKEEIIEILNKKGDK